MTWILSFFFGCPPVIQTILLLDRSAFLVDSNDVAFESLMNVQFPSFKNISCLCDNPLNDISDFKKAFLLILNSFVIKYANLILFLLVSSFRYLFKNKTNYSIKK